MKSSLIVESAIGQIPRSTERISSYYCAAALLAMQIAVIPMAIPSVCLSHAGTLSRRMKIESRGLHCEVAKTA